MITDKKQPNDIAPEDKCTETIDYSASSTVDTRQKSPQIENPWEMEQAISLLEECLTRMKMPSPNYSGGPWQAGGCYWRLIKVLQFVDDCLESVEGSSVAAIKRRVGCFLLVDNEPNKYETFYKHKRTLSLRAQNCLKSEEILSIDKLIEAFEYETISTIPNLGQVTRNELFFWACENFHEARTLLQPHHQFSKTNIVRISMKNEIIKRP